MLKFRDLCVVFLVSKKFTLSLAVLALGLVSFISEASAATLDAALIDRGVFVFPNGSPGSNSYDGPGKDSMQLFASFVAPNLYEVGSFTGHAGGSTVEAFMLSELAAFDGSNAGFANQFGVADSGNAFTSMIDTAVSDPLASGMTSQAEAQELTFAIQSPEGLFFSLDSKNTDDGVAHMLALKVDTAGTVNIPDPTLAGGGPLTFDLQVGDIVLFIEDMKKSGNVTSSLVPFASDFDYNDMVVVVRQTQVPEPASMMLLGLGAGAAAFRRRKKQS